MKKIFILFFIIITSVLMIMSCSSSEKSEKPKTNLETTAGNSTADGLVFNAYDLDGNYRSSSEFAGKPLVVNIWGTWCPPCRMEMPALQKIYDEYKPKGLEVIGLATEKRPNSQDAVKSFVEQNGYTWVMWMADNNNKAALGLGGGVPFTVFIDREGNVVHKHTGLMQYSQFKEYVDKII
ncbi:MAG: TlpA disulfide reductase family protein [Candidatus Zixiibacteriota bacterium]